MSKLKFWLTSTRIKLGVFFRPLFRLVTQIREAKERPRRRSYARLTSDEGNSKVFFVRFFSMCMYFMGWRLMRNKPLTEVWSLFFLCSPNFWSSSNHNDEAATMALNRRLHMHARFNSFVHLLVFVRKTTRKVMIKSWRFWDETQTFSRERSNSKRARTKFKLIGKLKMLRKFLKTITEGLAFLARSLSLFLHIYSLSYAKQEK